MASVTCGRRGARRSAGPAALALAATLFALGPAAVAAQGTGTLTGLVRDAVTLAPLPGAQVSVEGTGVGGLANNVGRYLLLNVPAGQQTVTATLIGYGQATQTVTVAGDQSAVVDFRLREEALSLEGVVVTGTAGSARRREIGNQISQVSSADIELAAVTDIGDILQGRSTGVQINDYGGQVGGGSQIRLRGNSSMQNDGNDPLIYIDGVRMLNGAIEVDDEAGASPSALDMINPNDIERIEIVKGPAATTLYGTEASGGVIQIFTKRGAAGAPAWALSVDGGVRSMGHQEGSLNGKDINPTGFYLNDCTVRREFDPNTMAFVTIPLTDPGAEAGCPDSGSWFRNGYLQRYNLSVRGGGETATYFVSGRYDDEQGVVAPQGAESYGVRANISFQPVDGLDISMNNSFQHRNITWIPDGNNASGFLLNVMRGSAGYTPGNNDALVFENDLNSGISQYQTSASIGWSPSIEWSHRVNVGLDYVVQDFLDWKYWDYYTEPTGARENDHDQDRNITFDYAGSFNGSPFESISSRLSFGGQLYEKYEYGLLGTDDSFAGPGEPEVGDGTNRNASEFRERVRSGGFFLQEEIGLADRLFLTGGVRWDGFSTFGEGFGLAAYPKVSASYLVSDESFWPSGIIQTLKLRAAWGESGKAPGIFEAEKLWAADQADEEVAAIVLDNFGNPDLGPERSSEIEAGFEAAAVDGRVSLEFTWYSQTTKDALIYVTPTPSAGTDNAVLRNLGRVDNWGTESALTVVPVRTDAVEWSVGAQYTTNDSEVADLGPLEDLGSTIQLGLPLRIAWDAMLQNPGVTGVEPELEDGMIGRLFPTDIMSLNTRLTLWNSLTFDVLGEGQYGHVRATGHAYQNMRRTSLANPVWPYCAPTLAQWEATPGPNSNRIANSGLTTNQIAECIQQYSDQGIWTRGADFFRLRSATLSWRLPEAWVPGTRSAQITVQGKNLLTWTDYIGLDPEAGDNGLSDDTPNDYYTFGPPRTLIFGLRVNF